MLFSIGLFFTLIAGLLYGLHYSVRGGRKGELIDKIPGPYAWPFVGNVFKFLVPLEEFWNIGHRMNWEFYPINRIWSIDIPHVNLYHPDDVEAILTSMKHIKKSVFYSFIHPWLGTGLLTSEGSKWHTRRRILTPAFHFNVLQQFVAIFNEQSEKLVKSLCLEGDEVVDDLVHLLHKFTLNSICETAMGATSDLNGQVQNEYRSCVSEMGDITLYRMLRPWWHSNWMFKFSQKFKCQVRALKVLHGFSTNIINERKRYHDETGGQFLQGLGGDGDPGVYSFEDESFKSRRRLTMLDLLISSSKREGSIDDEGIREEVDTFIFEGHDTTAMAICFTLMLLAENKQIQDEARAEVDEVFEGKKDEKLSMREVQGLAYLERCIKESLRLFPSVPFVSRQISEDLQLKNYLVPGGTVVNVHIYDLHRDPNFWPDPLVFDPDRFLPEQSQGRHPFAFVPFSAGPRNCIGQKFAMLELKVLVAHFLHNFYFDPMDFSSDVQILPDLVLRPSKPIRMKFVPRSRSNQVDCGKHSLGFYTSREIFPIFVFIVRIHLSTPDLMVGETMFLSIALFFTLVAGLLYGLHYSIHGSRKGELVDKIPGPYAWPIIGNILTFQVPLDELWNVIRRLNRDYYPIHRLWSISVPVVTAYHPDDVEVLFSNVRHIEKSFLYKFLHPWLGAGLLTNTGKKWHERRKILTPAFHFNVLQQFVAIFNEQSEKLVKSLCLEGDEVVDDLVHLLHKFTLNSICETAMGATSDLNGQVQNEYRSCVSEMGDIMFYRIVRPWWHLDWMFKFSRKFKEQVRALKVLHGFSTNIINERKRYHDETGGRFLKGLGRDSESSIYGFDDESVKGKRRLAMLDLLISASRREGSIDDEGIREEVDTFVFEGHDTTAMALCFALLLLAENKHIQDKARAEVDEVFEGKEDEKLSMREVQGLAYLERCIKESLRLFPSVPLVSRQISEDLQLKNYLVPGGTVVNVHIYDLHRDPNFWPDPLVFDPDRFLPEQSQGRHPFAFVPFSAGPRNCIGQKFAMLELKVLVAHFLHNFYLEPLDFSCDVKIVSDLVIRLTKPVRMKFVSRSEKNHD
ncbi:uncharacterized protein [Neodiprion pinetum]|uniref:uncharacterized protein n=1 Tax=Neodiprion pinetum TaxID=441929 RepID=UPI0037134B96